MPPGNWSPGVGVVGVEVAEEQRDFVGRVIGVGLAQGMGIDAQAAERKTRIVFGILVRSAHGAPQGLASQRVLEVIDRQPRDRIRHLLMELRSAFAGRQSFCASSADHPGSPARRSSHSRDRRRSHRDTRRAARVEPLPWDLNHHFADRSSYRSPPPNWDRWRRPAGNETGDRAERFGWRLLQAWHRILHGRWRRLAKR